MKFYISILFFIFTTFIQPAYSINIQAKAYVLKDLSTGNVILSKNADTFLPPASTTKLMTLYILFEQIKNGKIKLKDRLTVSKNAWKKGGSKMFLDPKQKVAVVDLIKGIAVDSGNDATTVIAEHIAGSEAKFVKMMNKKAKQFKMDNTNFKNPTGWSNTAHVSTANDLAILAERIINDFPQFYKVFKLKSFKFNNIRQYNKNTLLGTLGVDGLKTGHVHSVGYNIVSSAVKNGTRYLAVVLGTKSKARRESETKKLYQFAYEQYKPVKIINSSEVLATADTYLCDKKQINLGLNEDFKISLTKNELDNLKVELEYYPVINAPVFENQEVGTVNVYFKGAETPIRKSLVTKEACSQISTMDKYIKMVMYKLTGEF